jgi:hypothetical protein
VTIEGLNFVAGGTTVTFNGVAATGVSAAPTQISVTVPAGATSGRIGVATAGGSATSSSDFTVLANSTTPGVAWSTRRLGAPTGAVAFGAGKFVSAGSDIATSTDLMIWTDRSSLVNKRDVAWDGQKFVAVGMSTAMTSPDGLSWTSRSHAASFTKEKVAGSGSGWVAVGADGGIEFSADGIAWVDRTPSIPAGFNTLSEAVWTGSQFVVMGDSGLIFTSPDGTSWTQRSAGTTDRFTALAASPSLIVASTFPFSGSQQAFYTSADGVNWTQLAPGTAPFFSDMLRVGTRWVGVGTFGGSSGAQWSDDGLNWIAATGQFNQTPERVVHDGTRFVAFSSALSSSAETYVSPDGKSWTLMAPGDQKWTRMARSPTTGTMVAISFGRVQTSTDGIDWTYGVPPSITSGLVDVEWFAPLGQFVALSQVAANTAVFFSSDGLTWTQGSFVASTHNRAIGTSPTLIVNVPGFTGTGAAIYTSPDGINWTARTNPAAAALNEVQWLGDRWIALGSSGTVLTSPDGITWTARASGVGASLRRAVMVGSTITVVGDGGTILSSADGGASWIARTSNTTFPLKDIVWTGAEYVAVGGSGRAVRSTDGVTWSVQPTPYTQTLFGTDPYNMNAAVWAGSRIVVVGDRNLVATSP